MSEQNQYRMYWDCRPSGCFNHLMRPKFEAFSQAFPDKENFTDVDGILEKCGNALMLEWKENPGKIPTAQMIAYTNLSIGKRITVFIVAGDALKMTAKSFAFVLDGKYRDWKTCDMTYVLKQMSRWREWAVEHPRIKKPMLRVV